MPASLEIIYLAHSGFAVNCCKQVLVFDYYQDPSNSLDKLLQQEKTLQVFCSHSHEDHFNSKIKEWQENVEAYFLSEDIKKDFKLTDFPEEKTYFLNPYEIIETTDLKVSAYGSTDEGISFLADLDGWRIFHAGDLNWWQWSGETAAEQTAAEAKFRKELKHLAGLDIDVAFFPVDSRMGSDRVLGVQEFCRQVNVKQLIAMHTCGEAWYPAEDFTVNSTTAIWCPQNPGDKMLLAK